MSEKPRINVTLDEETYLQIKLLAHKEGRSMSDLLRTWADEKLNGEITKNNLDFICGIIREQLKDTLQPSVERLAALCAKGCVQSSTAAYLTAETIAKFVPLELQEDVQEVYINARKKAVRYTQSKVSSDEIIE